MKKLIKNIAIIIAIIISSVSYSNAQAYGRVQVGEDVVDNINIYTVLYNEPPCDCYTFQDVNKYFSRQQIEDSAFYWVESNEKYKLTQVGDHVDNVYTYTLTYNEKTFTKKIKFNVNTVGIKEVEVSNFNVYPNPVVDVLNIKFDSNEDVEVIVMDMSGRILSKELSSTMATVNMSDQPSGTYLVKIGNQTKRVMKQ